MGRIKEFSQTVSYTIGWHNVLTPAQGLNIEAGNKGVAAGSNGFYTHVGVSENRLNP